MIHGGLPVQSHHWAGSILTHKSFEIMFQVQEEYNCSYAHTTYKTCLPSRFSSPTALGILVDLSSEALERS